MIKIFISFLIVNMYLLACTPPCISQTKNFIVNPGFEYDNNSNLVNWITDVPEHTNSSRLGIDSIETHSGTKSFKISKIWIFPRESIVLKTAQAISLEPQKNYLFSFWYKTKGIEEYPLPFRSQFRIDCENNPSVIYGKQVPSSDSWQQYFIFLDNIPKDGKEISFSFNTLVNTKGSIWLDDIEFREATEKDSIHFEHWRRQSVPELSGNVAGRKFKPTGFYRVEKTKNRWWLIDPNGHPTWAIAIDGTQRSARTLGEVDTRSPWFIREFGSSTKEFTEKMYSIYTDSCGFNAFAGWTGDEFAQVSEELYESGKPYMPMTRVLGLAMVGRDSSLFAKDRNGRLLAGGHAFPDPFNPEWKRKAREKAERVIAPYKNKPWFLGWFVDNEMDFGELFRYIWAERSSKEFIRVLEEKYKIIDSLNIAWSSPFGTYHYTSFTDILDDKPEPKEWDDPVWIDFAAFERHMIKEYIDFTYDLVKELDPNHLVMSNRINLDPMPEAYRTMDLWGKYDIVCMNIYPDNNKIGFNRGEIEIMKKLFERTGRPVMIGEWSVPAIDSGLYGFEVDSLGRPLDWSWPQVLRTQKERGEAYEVCIKQLASLNFMVGAGWFITFDANTRQRRANRGIMNTDFELYKDLTDAMKNANNDIKNELGITW